MNYDKWNLVDVSSDDEDPADFHPNVDPRLIRRLKKEKKGRERDEELDRLREEVQQGGEEAEVAKKILDRYEEAKNTPIVREVSSRTVINREPSKKPDWIPSGPASMPGAAGVAEQPAVNPFEDTDEGFTEFSKQFKATCLRYVRLTELEELEEFLLANHQVMLHKHAQGVLLLSLLDLEMKGDTATMKKYCRQYLMLANILDLAKGLNTDPRAALKPFFERIRTKESKQNLAREVENFSRSIQQRAEQKRLEEAEEEEEEVQQTGVGSLEELSLEERLGPGGLDPVEVFAELPVSWQEAFSERDMEKLQKAIHDVPLEDARRLLKMCEDSGLWNPGPQQGDEGEQEQEEQQQQHQRQDDAKEEE